MLNPEKIAAVVVTLETPAKILALFLVFLYVMWFWKKGFYDGFMESMMVIRNVLEKGAIFLYAAMVWICVGFIRVLRIIFATVRDFFISRI